MGTTSVPAPGSPLTPASSAASKFRVAADGLNLRSEPRVAPATRLAVLHRGDVVRKLERADDPAWWLVETVIDTEPVRGYVAHRHLVAETAHPPTPAAAAVTAVHLGEGRPSVTRAATGSAYAYPLGEPGQPRRRGNAPAERARSLGEIVRWLDVESSRRYQPHGTATYCNIYAADYCYLAGAYLPRVWWTGRALERLARGERVEVRYDVTVREMTANQLYGWLVDYGPQFGWKRTTDPHLVQERANAGEVGIICAQRTDLNRPGHIVAVVPEVPGRHSALRGATGLVTVPLHSQAGSTCFGYGCRTPAWWTQSKFRAFGFWHHA